MRRLALENVFLVLFLVNLFVYVTHGDRLNFLQDFWISALNKHPIYVYKTQQAFSDTSWLNQYSENDKKILNWIRGNISGQTKLPLSFYVPPYLKKQIYKRVGPKNSVEAIMERMVLEEGLIIYDGAVGQIALALEGNKDDLKLATIPTEIYWKGQVGELSNIRAGFPINLFIYNTEAPEAVSSSLHEEGRRGFVFRIINAHGRYRTMDPLDGKQYVKGFPNLPRIHWEDWKPIAGENAWIVMAALQVFHRKHFNEQEENYFLSSDSVELKLAKEITRAAIYLQSEVGGIRMAPLGTPPTTQTYADPKYASLFYEISTENNISWYAALRMMYQITQDPVYQSALFDIEEYFKTVWNDQEKFFYQGMNYRGKQWRVNDQHFALDVQTWGIAALGPEKIDMWFGEGTSYLIWKKSKELSGVKDKQGRLIGVGYSHEHDRLSVEWTAGAVLAAKAICEFYRKSHPKWAKEALDDAKSMRQGIEKLRRNIGQDQLAYSYSSKRGWIPFGWFSQDPQVMSLASTGWVYFIDRNFNPFYLPFYQ